MGAPGFIYVLANPSMPDLVKIGRTERSAADRVRELSAATGVPTPFVLIYEAAFDDCAEAEVLIHRELEERGARLAPNREFFTVRIHEAVRAVVEAQLNTTSSEEDSLSLVGTTQSNTGDPFLDSLNLREDALVRSLLTEADGYRVNLNRTPEDLRRAFALYKRAAELGSTRALLILGDMYAEGEGTAPSLANALEYWKRAAAAGEVAAYASMAPVFRRQGQHDAATKCWDRFFEQFERMEHKEAALGGIEYIRETLDTPEVGVNHAYVEKLHRERARILYTISSALPRVSGEAFKRTFLLRDAAVRLLGSSPSRPPDHIDRCVLQLESGQEDVFEDRESVMRWWIEHKLAHGYVWDPESRTWFALELLMTEPTAPPARTDVWITRGLSGREIAAPDERTVLHQKAHQIISPDDWLWNPHYHRWMKVSDLTG